jgi:hypothetical protein
MLIIPTNHFSDMNISNFIDNPFHYKKNNDILSLIFYRYYTYSDIPTSTPIFAFLSYMSCFLITQDIKFKLEGGNSNTLDLWLLILAHTGQSKTLSTQGILKLFPNEGNEITPKIGGSVSEKSLCMEMQKNPKGIWINDEGVKTILEIEKVNSPLHEVKRLLLEIKTSHTYTRKNSNPSESITLNNVAYSLLFLGNYEDIDYMKKRNLPSFHDGLFRRFKFIDGSDVQGRRMEDYPLYKFPVKEDENLRIRIAEILEQKFFPEYIITNAAQNIYEETFRNTWKRGNIEYLQNGVVEQQFRTHLMESFKFAVLDHIIRKKAGYKIGKESMQTGLKIALYLLDCYTQIINKKTKNQNFAQESKSLNTKKLSNEKIENIKRVLINTPDIKNRDLCRKFGVRVEDILALKIELEKTHDRN